MSEKSLSPIHDAPRSIAEKDQFLLPFSREEIELIKSDICKGASDAELKMFLIKCRRTQLDPFQKQIYSIKRWVSGDGGGPGAYLHQTQVSIDGARLIAERTGRYEGQIGPLYCGPDAVWREVWLEDTPPSAAKVAVLKSGLQPMWATARFSSYVQTKKDGSPNAMWSKMPDTMLAKCAEMLALRKAFPADLAGLYSAEEMGQADNGSVPPVNYEVDPEKVKWLNNVQALAKIVFKSEEDWSEYLGEVDLSSMTVEAIQVYGAELKAHGIKIGRIRPPAAPAPAQEAKEEPPATAAPAATPAPAATVKPPSKAAFKLFWTTVNEKLSVGGQYIGDEAFYWWLGEKALAPYDDSKDRVSVSKMSQKDLSEALELISHTKPEEVLRSYGEWKAEQNAAEWEEVAQ